MQSTEIDNRGNDDILLESLPDAVEASIQVRDRWFRNVSGGDDVQEFLISDLQSWQPGQTVRVAFLDGNSDLHRDVADATAEITDACNLILDFGFDQASGVFRRWTESDDDHAADIRVSFDKKGFFSLVGTDSINRTIGSPLERIGGRPRQCSLNLGDFQNNRPDDWQGVVRHEFLHALAFHHAHQNMRGPCEQAFRWEDDEGYEPTSDQDGRFIRDSEGRRPGIYTFLAGAPNFWDKAKVDHNLRTEDDPDLVAGPFDRSSVMLYRFPSLFYHDPNSSCAPLGDGISLSDGDRRGLRLLYPTFAGEEEAGFDRKGALAALIRSRSPSLGSGDEEESAIGGNGSSPYAAEAIRILGHRN